MVGICCEKGLGVNPSPRFLRPRLLLPNADILSPNLTTSIGKLPKNFFGKILMQPKFFCRTIVYPSLDKYFAILKSPGRIVKSRKKVGMAITKGNWLTVLSRDHTSWEARWKRRTSRNHPP